MSSHSDDMGVNSPSTADEVRYHLLVAGSSEGPYSEEQILVKIADGELDGQTFLWREGDPDWRRVNDLFKTQTASTVPPDPPRPPPPPLIALTSAMSVQASTTPYPKWAPIVTAIFALLWVGSFYSMGAIEDRTRPLLAETERMKTDGFTQEVVLETFLRAANNGDYLGKVFEVVGQQNRLRSDLVQLAAEYRRAKSWSTRWFVLTLLLGGVAVWQHLRWRKDNLVLQS